jgi:hypothetical protein
VKAKGNLMATDNEASRISKAIHWVARVMSGLPILFLLMDAAMKLLKLPMVVDATVKLGYRESTIVPLGIVLLVCTLLYAIPRTAVLGAILLTGYLGGAVATHVRMGEESVFSIVFAIAFGVLIWGGLFLRDARIRALIPITRKGD